MTTADLIARLRAGTITPEICEAAAVALERITIDRDKKAKDCCDLMDRLDHARDDALEEAAINIENMPLKGYTIYPDEWKTPDEAAECIRALKGITK